MIQVFKPSIGKEETEAVAEVLHSGWLGSGPRTEEFEKKFNELVGAKYGIAVNSASAALHLAVIAGNITGGDEVITPSLTFVATNHPLLMVGATPVFADVNEQTLCVDPKDIERKITGRTKAVIVVHYGGHPVDLKPVVDLCEKNKLILIEDCAHAVGSYYKGKHVGSFGDFGCFSFAAIKNLTTGDGGMVVCKKKSIADRIRTLAWSGISQTTWQRTKSKKYKWQYSVKELGYKYQMNDIAAAIGLVQLRKLKENNEKRKKITEIYNKMLDGIPWIKTPVVKPWVKSSHHNYVVRVDKKIRDKVVDYLSSKGVATSVHYVPNHYYEIYKKFPNNVPVTEKVWQELFLLPIFPDLTLEQVKFICQTLAKFTP